MKGRYDCPVCGGFKEMHATEEQELEAWNRRADMAEYVDRGALQAALVRKQCGDANQRYTEGWNDCLLRVKSMVSKAPTSDVAPVIHGKWIDGAEDFTCGNRDAECSICGCYISWNGCDEDFNYCPNCGAKMD